MFNDFYVDKEEEYIIRFQLNPMLPPLMELEFHPNVYRHMPFTALLLQPAAEEEEEAEVRHRRVVDDQ
ncbi:Hypothetical predicted protein [Olea europaea subsp. europaea]|uniref:Uncharacterized protein n=1 Tax=Olea europaea subsp. europaea TaxID=158383 RepID=A0A8S0V0M8_OLEEU|nr:Hypothetical predicted protein [Olea europaea subsp. europaea]